MHVFCPVFQIGGVNELLSFWGPMCNARCTSEGEIPRSHDRGDGMDITGIAKIMPIMETIPETATKARKPTKKMS
jgi:hypothetical protein